MMEKSDLYGTDPVDLTERETKKIEELLARRHDGEKMEQVTTRDHGVVLEEQVEDD